MKYLYTIVVLSLIFSACKEEERIPIPEEEELIRFPIFDSGDQTYGNMKGIRNLDEWEAGAYAYYESDSTFAIGGYTTSPYWFGDTLIREHLTVRNIPLEENKYFILDSRNLPPHVRAAKGRYSTKTDDDAGNVYEVDTTDFLVNHIYIDHLDTLQDEVRGTFSLRFRGRAPEHYNLPYQLFPRVIQFEEVEFDVKFREF